MTITDPILTALEAQVRCYQMLAKLADLQHQFVTNNQTDQLLEVLQRRQLVLDQIARLEQTLLPAKQRWSAHVQSLAKDHRAKAESLLAETRQLLERITTADRHDSIILQQRKLTLGSQISRTRTARTVNKTYAAVTSGRTGLVDIQQ